MTTTAQNKQTAEEFFARFTASDIDGALALMTDDATWWIPGKPEATPTAGLYPKERIAHSLHAYFLLT